MALVTISLHTLLLGMLLIIFAYTTSGCKHPLSFLLNILPFIATQVAPSFLPWCLLWHKSRPNSRYIVQPKLPLLTLAHLFYLSSAPSRLQLVAIFSLLAFLYNISCKLWRTRPPDKHVHKYLGHLTYCLVWMYFNTEVAFSGLCAENLLVVCFEKWSHFYISLCRSSLDASVEACIFPLVAGK